MAGKRRDAIEVIGYDSAEIGADGLRDGYLDSVGRTVELEFLTGPVEGRIESGFLGTTYLMVVDVSPLRSARTAALIGHDRIDSISLVLAVSGRATGQAGKRRVTSEPGSITILDLSQPHEFADDGRRRTIVLVFPRPKLAARLGDPGELHGRVIPPERAMLLSAHMRALAQQLSQLPSVVGGRLANIALDLLAIAIDPQQPDPAVARGDRRDLLAARARRLIESQLGSTDLTPERLAAQLNVSRSDLYSLFEDAGGVSRHIWWRRLEAARAALTDPGDTRRVGEVAFACGFSSEAHFSRAFRRQFGISPTAARKMGEL